MTGLLFWVLLYIWVPELENLGINAIYVFYLGKWLKIVGFLSLVFGFYSFYPTKVANLYTDGFHLWMLTQKGPRADCEHAIWLLKSLSIAGQRPRYWPERAVAAATGLEDKSPFEFIGRLFGYLHALDTQRYDVAQYQLKRIMMLWSTIVPAMRPAVALEVAYFEASFFNDTQRARAWLEKGTSGSFINNADALRSEMAVLVAEGQTDKAKALIAPFQQAINESIDVGMAIAEREWVKNIFAVD